MRLETISPADSKCLFPLTTLPLSFCLLFHTLLLPSSHPYVFWNHNVCLLGGFWVLLLFVFYFQQQHYQTSGGLCSLSGAIDAGCALLTVEGKLQWHSQHSSERLQGELHQLKPLKVFWEQGRQVPDYSQAQILFSCSRGRHANCSFPCACNVSAMSISHAMP